MAFITNLRFLWHYQMSLSGTNKTVQNRNTPGKIQKQKQETDGERKLKKKVLFCRKMCPQRAFLEIDVKHTFYIDGEWSQFKTTTEKLYIFNNKINGTPSPALRECVSRST